MKWIKLPFTLKSIDPEKRMIIRCLLAFLLLCALLAIKKEYIDIPKTSVSTYSYTQNRVDLVPFGQCDITDQFVYFTYRMKKTIVVVYDLNANYLQTIEFTDSENGAAYIRSDQDHLVLKLRNNSVFFISGETVTTTLTEEEADRLGYTDEWFESFKRKVEVKKESVSVYNEEGSIVTFPLPRKELAFNKVIKLLVVLVPVVLAGILKLRIKRQSST